MVVRCPRMPRAVRVTIGARTIIAQFDHAHNDFYDAQCFLMRVFYACSIRKNNSGINE